jgi:hypothetical protein
VTAIEVETSVPGHDHSKSVRRDVRFGLKESNELGSPLWRIWVQGEETYLAVRTAIGLSKISLHSSGKWVFTAGTGRVSINGPRPLNDDWSVGPRIVFPGVLPAHRLATYEHEIPKRTYLFQSPPKNHWRDFAVLFGERSADPGDLGKLLPSDLDAIGPMPLRSGRATWLATFVTAMTPKEVDYVNSERAKFCVTIKGGIGTMRAPWATVIQDVENGDTMIVNIELGRDNIALRDSRPLR